MKATINGRAHELPGELTVAALLELLGSPTSGVAVARNDRVVRHSEYSSDVVREGDRLEIIQAVAGG
ncbi:MAG: sulfur carrier protein ThiS [Candidatus Eremiobacteraeota bacterium]|nr:sulfur carrier protein ThiS [Candidatus Eremiobacteraeota bacterium]MBV8498277.1 sulfur carrier protein ThiS [Candidatus Eremiobacteraeota bacterium]